MKILAIDPGFERMGIAVLERTGGAKPRVLYSACVRTSPKESFHLRLRDIGAAVRDTITRYAPEALAIERLFFAANQRTALAVSEARGVAVYEAARGGLSVFEYTPIQIKAAVSGYGHADKRQVILMVPRLVSFADAAKSPHTNPFVVPKDSAKRNKRIGVGASPSAALGASDDEFDAIAVGITHFAHYSAPR